MACSLELQSMPLILVVAEEEQMHGTVEHGETVLEPR